MLQHYTFFIFLLLLDYSLGEPNPLVETSLGKIKGHHKHSYGGRTFSAFEGIPYAKPPIGDLRFEEPLSADPWSSTWDATVTHECMQLHFFTLEPFGSEDCLYLNVYVPKEQPVPNENLDVVVYLHGGGFMLGSAELGGPEYLMDRNIVYVTLNYRLGVLGFLSTEDDVVRGNMGMKDQVLALKWVQNHIERFGGNPKSVTIIGLSAGGAAVHLHYFSPLSKGLFHRGISQSGVALAPWVIQEAPLERARQLATLIGCNDPSSKELIRCLKQRSAKQVILDSYNLSPYPQLPVAPFAPVVEKKSKGAFLTDYPYKLLSRGEVTDVPWITSATTEEGMLFLGLLNNTLDVVNKQWNTILPHLLDYNHTVADVDKPKLAQKIKQFYFGEEEVGSNSIQKFIKLAGDRYFTLDLEKSARMHAKLTNSPIYSYIYGYRGDHNFNIVPSNDYYGVNHGEDGYLLYQGRFAGITLKTDKLSESDERIKNLLVDMVVSFAKNGKPEVNGIEWDSAKESEDFQYLFIHNDDIKMVSKKELAPTEFWHSLHIKENENIVALKDEL